MECKLDSTTVHYEAHGEGRPLVMLHGGYGDHQYLSMSIEPLFENRSGWERIYPDLPGHGRTVAPEWMGTMDQVLDVLLDFIAHVIPGQRFSVGGYSWGGYLAQGIVYRRAVDLDGVLLIAPVVHASTEGKPEQTVLVRDETLLAGLDEETKQWVEINVVQDPIVVDRVRRLLPAYRTMGTDDQAFKDRLQQSNKFSFDPGALSQPFDKPTLFLLSRQDYVVGYRDQWDLIENYARASFVVLDRAGHFAVPVEHYALCQVLMSEWLDRLEESANL